MADGMYDGPLHNSCPAISLLICSIKPKSLCFITHIANKYIPDPVALLFNGYILVCGGWSFPISRPPVPYQGTLAVRFYFYTISTSLKAGFYKHKFHSYIELMSECFQSPDSLQISKIYPIFC